MSLSLRMAPALSLRLDGECTLCYQRLPEEPRPLSRERQFERISPGCGFGKTNPCLKCGQIVPDETIHNSNYRARVRRVVAVLQREKTEFDKRLAKMKADRDWPAGTKSLVGQKFDGNCLLCPDTDMLVVKGDFYECPTCRLQLVLTGSGVEIKSLKGLKEFKQCPEPSASINMEGRWIPVSADHRVKGS